MPGGCWICNPLCGKCQPAPKKSDLTALVRPEPLRCNYSGLVCAYPCGKGASAHPEHGYQVCRRNTPPTEEWLAAHPEA